jgi:hypothetical protein
MNRIEFTASVLGMIRNEKNPPLARYCIVMAAAAGGPEGATVREMAKLLGDPVEHMGGCMQKIADAGWIRPVKAGVRPARWTPTAKGLEIVARLTLAKPATA